MTATRPAPGDLPLRRALRAAALPAAAGAVVAAVVALSISRTIPFDSDEANHANLALRQWQDLREGAFLDFLRHSYRTGQFPFFHGWTVVPFLALFGETLFAARVAQCLHFVVGVAATAHAAFRATGGDRRAAAIAGSLFALSPLLGAMSGLCMLETPGAAATALTLALLAEALRPDAHPSWKLDVLTALAVLATWFTKLNYGIWILPAAGLGYLVRALRPDERRFAVAGLLRYCAVLVLCLGVWYSTAEARAQFAGFLTNPAQAVPVVEDDPGFRIPGLRWDNFAGYFGMVAADYHVHFTVGAAALVLFAAGTWRAVRARNAALAAAAACVVWTWLSLSMGFREYPLARFIAPALPALWIVAASAVPRLPAGRAWSAAGLALLAAGLLAQCIAVRRVLTAEYEVDDRFRPVFAHLAEAIPRRSSVLVVNYTDHVSARALVWELATAPGATYRDHDVKTLVGERIYESDRAFDVWMTARRPWGADDWQSHIVEMVPGPAFHDHAALVAETVARWRAAIERSGHRLDLASERRFDALDLTVRVWRDRTPPPHLGTRPQRSGGR